MMTKNSICRIIIFFALTLVSVAAFSMDVYAVNFPDIGIIVGNEVDADALGNSVTLQILFISILIALLPSILVVMTSFTRYIIVLSFVRSGLGTQQMPPNTVLIGLALVLTMFTMNTYIQEINTTALEPFAAGQISQEEAIEAAMVPLRDFMVRQGYGNTQGSSTLRAVGFFAQISGTEWDPADYSTIPDYVLVPAFILHELTVGFAIGVLMYIPFIVIDMVVASVLMAMGMMMLPPAMISLPFKVLLFVLVDGWRLVLQNVMLTFQ